MERLVLYLCGLWFWLTRKYHASHYRDVAELLDSAKLYLISDFHGRASTLDRGGLLPDQLEALRILERQHAQVTETSRRFESFTDCVRLVSEELIQRPEAA